MLLLPRRIFEKIRRLKKHRILAGLIHFSRLKLAFFKKVAFLPTQKKFDYVHGQPRVEESCLCPSFKKERTGELEAGDVIQSKSSEFIEGRRGTSIPGGTNGNGRGGGDPFASLSKSRC